MKFRAKVGLPPASRAGNKLLSGMACFALIPGHLLSRLRRARFGAVRLRERQTFRKLPAY